MARVVNRRNLVVPHEYTTSDGQKRTRWQTIGKAFYLDSGAEFLRIDAIPTGAWDGTVQVFDEQDDTQNDGKYSGQNNGDRCPRQNNGKGGSGTYDDLPF